MGYRGLLIGSAFVVGCYQPSQIADGTVVCGGANGDCPSGYTCGCDGFCRATTATRRTGPDDPLPPPIERGVWEKVAGVADRFAPSLAFDPIRRETVLFSGTGSDYYGGDTWVWNGSRWSWRSDSGPQVRTAASMAFDHARGEMLLFGGDCAYYCANAETWTWNGVQWRQVAATGPRQVGYAAMVDDEARSQVLLFGGRPANNMVSGELWAWNGTAWTQMCTDAACAANRPEPRAEHNMVYDRTRQRTVLFGGANASNTRLADIWEWDGTSWTRVCTSAACMATSPTPREGHAMYYDSTRQRVVVFGGFIPGTGITDEQWEWDGVQWTASNETRPSGRYYATASFDEIRNVAVLFGGNTPATSIAETDTWEHGAAGWTSVDAGSPSAAEWPGIAYDPVRGTVAISGGYNAFDNFMWEWTADGRFERTCGDAVCHTFPARNGPLVYDEARAEMLWFDTPGLLWSWKNGMWTQECTEAPCNATVPTGFSATVAYDRARAVVVIGTSANELWEWDGAEFAQKCTDAACLAMRPAAAAPELSFAYDRERAVVVQYTSSGQTWEWNGTAWTQQCMTTPCSASTPLPRYGATLAYQPVRKTVQLFGGATITGQKADLWEWNGAAWTKLSEGGPLPREGAGVVFNERRGRLTLYGGESEEGVATLPDVWEFHVRGGACTSGAQCDSGFCTDGVCCDQASCGSCQACNVGLDAGTCATLTDREDADSCAGASACGPTGTCGLDAGEACTADPDCASGRCNTDPCEQVCL